MRLPSFEWNPFNPFTENWLRSSSSSKHSFPLLAVKDVNDQETQGDYVNILAVDKSLAKIARHVTCNYQSMYCRA